MNVYVFGNPDFGGDVVALEAARKLGGKVKGVEFVIVTPNEDLPFADKSDVVIMDAVQGIDKTTVIGEEDLDNLKVDRSVTAHDFDLGFQLKYLKKLGKLKKFTIIGLPQNGDYDYLRIQSILRKLVEQDMQGS